MKEVKQAKQDQQSKQDIQVKHDNEQFETFKNAAWTLFILKKYGLIFYQYLMIHKN